MSPAWLTKSDKVRIYDDAILRAHVQDVTDFGPELAGLIDRLYRVQKRDRAIGVAATQIGEPRNVFVINGGEITRGGRPEAFVNARILAIDGDSLDEEGCLSFPDVFIPVLRPSRVTISAQDQAGRQIEREGHGLLARAFSHEIDHLQGRLIIDRVSPVVREKIIARMKVRQPKNS
jgi:peptide deformylase